MTEYTRSLQGSRILITGGTGSLGRAIAEELLSGNHGFPSHIVIFSRDEEKQYHMLRELSDKYGLTVPVSIYGVIGDIRNYNSVRAALFCRDGVGVNYIVHAAAMKHVPLCEENPMEAIRINVDGAHILVRAIVEQPFFAQIRTIGLSTDKACRPICIMGITKALQERIFQSNYKLGKLSGHTFACVRMGNMLESSGSVIPFYRRLAAEGKRLPVTHENMNRFFIRLKDAARIVCKALRRNEDRVIYYPNRMKSAYIRDIAEIIGGQDQFYYTGIRPGEKLSDQLVSEEEVTRLINPDEEFNYILPADQGSAKLPGVGVFSHNHLMSRDELERLLKEGAK